MTIKDIILAEMFRRGKKAGKYNLNGTLLFENDNDEHYEWYKEQHRKLSQALCDKYPLE